MTQPRPLRRSSPNVSRLTIRLIAVLSLAILPLGLISMYQTWRLLEEGQNLSKTGLLERTRGAIRQGNRLIEHGFGAAEALAGTVIAMRRRSEECDFPFSWLVDSDDAFAFSAYVNDQGDVLCASNRSRPSLAGTRFFSDLAATEGPDASIAANVAEEGRTVLNLSIPVREPDVRGFVWIAIAVEDANRLLTSDDRDVDLALFNETGEILATAEYSDDRRDVLPAQRSLADLPASVGYTFRGPNRQGSIRDFAVVPIVENTIYALGSWPPAETRVQMFSWRSLGLYFPALIWLASMLAAVIGLHRMVFRHINRLRNWMQLYADHRFDFENARLDHAPEELEAVARTFRAMTARIAEQDRRRDEDLEEKTVLLREVHHRVKNNLQVISSIMNMKARSARSDEARGMIRRLQGRIMALASIHRRLYMSRRLSMIRADELLQDIMDNLETVSEGGDDGGALTISTHFDPLPIVPEQSMPLSLLVTEAATNAVKYCGTSGGATPWIDIALSAQEDGRVCLSVVNSCGPEAPDEPPSEETGLGIELIETFATQLGGTLEHRRLCDRYELHVTFTLARPEDIDGEEDTVP